MFELLTCQAPLADINYPAIHVCNGGRPNITSEVSKDYKWIVVHV